MIIFDMTPIQIAIKNALLAMGDKSKFTDKILAKKLRETLKIDGMKKAVISIDDLLPVIDAVSECGKIFSLTVTNANDILIERTETSKELALENIQRRRRHEKSLMIFTNKCV